MLPQLLKLDDRGVYDQEREAALLHFSSDQVYHFSLESPDTANRSNEAANRSLTENQTHPRVKMVQKSFPPTHSALDDDDVTLLDILSKSRAELIPAPLPIVETVPAGNLFTELEERVQSRLDVKSNFGQVFVSFLKDITEVIRQHWTDKVSVGFVDDLNELVERNFLDLCEKEEWVARREERWEREKTELLNRVEAKEEEKQDHENKLTELAREISNLKSLENEHFPMKTAFLELKEENKQLKERLNFHEKRGLELNERIQPMEYQNENLETSLRDERRNLEQAHASLKEIRGLAAMLQETHHTLMANNNAILRENTQMKERHEQEINQMHLSYQQLRKSFEVWKEVNKPPPRNF